MNSHPSSDSIRSMVRLGGAAPATTTLMVPLPGRAPSQSGSASRTALTTAGAAHSSVTPWPSTLCRISAPSTLRSTTWEQPMAVVDHGMPQPLAWNMGCLLYTSDAADEEDS